MGLKPPLSLQSAITFPPNRMLLLLLLLFIIIIIIIFFFLICMSGRSGLVLCGQKCALKSNMIETLNADGKPLEEKRGFHVIIIIILRVIIDIVIESVLRRGTPLV